MRLRKSTRTLLATLCIALMCVIGLQLTVNDNVAANPSDTLTDEEPTGDDFDFPDEDNELDDDFEGEEMPAEDDDNKMQDFDTDEMEEVELHHMEIETNIAHLEMINRLAEIANDDVAMASYAVMHLEEFMESEEAGIQTLKELIASEQVSHPVKNLLKMKLAELYSWSDQEDAAIDTFKSMLMSK